MSFYTDHKKCRLFEKLVVYAHRMSSYTCKNIVQDFLHVKVFFFRCQGHMLPCAKLNFSKTANYIIYETIRLNLETLIKTCIDDVTNKA